MKITQTILLIFFLLAKPLSAQIKSTTVAIQYKPIIPFKFLGTGPVEAKVDDVDFSISQNLGFNFGMIIRRAFGNNLAYETGISFVRRQYEIAIHNPLTAQGGFRMVGYEIPFNLLVFIQLGENAFMNASAGSGLLMFPSDLATRTSLYEQMAGRVGIFNLSLNANVGFEWRTTQNGAFYLGTTFHRPFWNIYRNIIEYYPTEPNTKWITNLRGAYFTIDFRYYFPESKDKRKSRDKYY